MKYFIDTHDKTKGSFPTQVLTEEQFIEQFDELDRVAVQFGAFGHAAHVNLEAGKAFCFMSGPDEEAIRKAHAAINLPFDSITQVKRVTGADMRGSGSKKHKQTGEAPQSSIASLAGLAGTPSAESGLGGLAGLAA
jgi:hypothetical protein